MKSMKVKRQKAFFSISAVAKMFSVHQQTIRLYEKEGLITPKRSEGNTRLFSEEDVNRLEEIIYLTHQLGINLAGVEMIFKLKKQIAKMQKDMNAIFEETQHELDKESETSKQVAQASMKQLMALKKEKEPHATVVESPAKSTQDDDKDPWKIEYEDY
ncbi:MAG: MerR family transcriptional regulator [Candidatus Babeliales bacterium]